MVLCGEGCNEGGESAARVGEGCNEVGVGRVCEQEGDARILIWNRNETVDDLSSGSKLICGKCCQNNEGKGFVNQGKDLQKGAPRMKISIKK